MKRLPLALLVVTLSGTLAPSIADISPAELPRPGRDSAVRVNGGCELGPTGEVAYDNYLDAGEQASVDVGFTSSVSLTDATVTLRVVATDADSPASCLPGSTDCADPNRTNNPLVPDLSVSGSPQFFASVPAGATHVVSVLMALDSAVDLEHLRASDRLGE